MKTRQLERTSSCCCSGLYAMLQQCTKAIPPASGFIYLVPAVQYIHNAHPPPDGFLRS